MNVFRWFAAVLLSVSLIAAATAQPPVSPHNQATPLLLSVEYADGHEAEIKCVSRLFRIEVEYGTIDLNLDKIKLINFKLDGEKLLANVELLDKTHMNGTALTTELTLDEKETLVLRDVRAFKIIRPKNWSLLSLAFGLIMLTVMEIVLGIDNIIFLAIVASRLPSEQQRPARRIGLVAALATRLGLLFTLSFILGLTKPVITIPIPGLAAESADLSWRDIILIVGGGFLIFKSVRELHHKFEESHGDNPKKIRKASSFIKTILLISIIDIVFSLDSVITAVGMVDSLEVMIGAMVIAMGVMMVFAEPVSRFVETYPTIKVLALSFLILIGVLLVAEGLGQHIEKGYVYFAMAFAVIIEFINIRLRPKSLPEAVADG